ncbi:MFS transporter [Cellvibrio mixtus]|uniref:MFS transporter n=1 Tax=Cellvibrio mixtus TaxID=39650 RepID=A0A266QBA4_9GAMM|nr:MULTISPECIES: MFS transporter [Cellvibrio]AQT62028.1 MFS transporter [Cellvibrio sp. PSBB023]OZY86651.1 MFS transporter [Cellvibrio mixtus]
MSNVPATRSASSMAVASRTRWGILAMLFIVTTINYADRATISIAGPDIARDIGLSPIEMGYIFSAFAWSYVLAQIPGGWLLDKFGSKMTYFFSILLWSLFTLFQGFVGFFTGGAALLMLILLRLLVGAAEAPAFPGNSRITSAWFPTHERGFAASIFNSAQYFATVAFAPLMGWMVYHYGWQSIFLFMGLLGVVIALIWLKTIHSPKEHPSISDNELRYIEEGGALVDLDSANSNASTKVNTLACVKELLGSRMLLGVYIGQYCINSLTYFFLTWFPIYLVQERGMNILQAGFMASLPAIAGFLGGISGGWLSDRLMKKGYSLTLARKLPIVIGMFMSTSMIACNYVDTDVLVIAIMSLAFFGKGVGALGWAVVSDTSPKEAGGLSGGLFNTFGNTAGIVTPIVIGYIVHTTGSFEGALAYVGAHAALAIISYLFVVGDIKRITLHHSVHSSANR